MRSNGVAHVGHDTFICATRDCTDSLFLLTSAFDADNRVAALPLRRRLRVVPDSSLPHAQGSTREDDIDDDDDIPVTVRDVREEVYPDDAAYARRAAATAARGHSVRSTSREGSAARALVPYDGALTPGVRHSLHTSVNGRYVAAISSGSHHHYLLDLKYEPAAVTEFATEATVRSACWHVARPTLLFLLLVSDELVVYDVTQVQLYVALRHVCRVPLRALLRRYTLPSPPATTTTATQAAAGRNKAQMSDKDVFATQRERPTLDIDKEDEDDAATRTATPLSPPAAATAQDTRRARWATTEAPRVDEFGRRIESTPCTASNSSSSKGKNKNKKKDASSPTEAAVADKLLRDIALVRRTGGSVTRPVSAAAAALQTPRDAPKPRTGALVRTSPMNESKPTSKAANAGQADMASSADRALYAAVNVRPHDAQGGRHAPHPGPSLPLTAVREERRPTSALRLVDMTMVCATRSMPPVLLLLSSSGDVFAMSLEVNTGLPVHGIMHDNDDEDDDEGGAAGGRDGRLRLAEDTNRKEMQGRVLRHILPASALATTVDEEALALRCALLDEDTGLHAVVVCFSSGVLRGAWASEPELLARGRIARYTNNKNNNNNNNKNNNKKGSEAQRKKTGKQQQQEEEKGTSEDASSALYTFRVDLGRAVNSRAFVSHTQGVPTTTHTVQMSLRGNLCLVRYDDETAYLVALPVWDVLRKGWSYWCPKGAIDTLSKERLALPLVSTAPAVPAVLALRIPFDVAGAGLALGCNELVIVPELAACKERTGGAGSTPRNVSGDVRQTSEECVREYSVSMQITSLLRSALYARCGDLRRVYTREPREGSAHPQPSNKKKTPPMTGSNNNSSRSSNKRREEAGQVESMALLPPPSTAFPHHRTKGTAASASGTGDDDEEMSLDTTLDCVARCHRLFLCGHEAEAVDGCTAELAARVEATVAAVRQREQHLERRQHALESRVSGLLRRARATRADVLDEQRVVLDRIVHRRGMPAVAKATETLQFVTSQLDALESLLRLNEMQSQ